MIFNDLATGKNLRFVHKVCVNLQEAFNACRKPMPWGGVCLYGRNTEGGLGFKLDETFEKLKYVYTDLYLDETESVSQ